MSDHPDIIWVNEYPNSSGVSHPSRAKAEASVMHDGTTAAYQRLPDGVDPETHNLMTYWATVWDDGSVWDCDDRPPEDPSEDTHIIEVTGWLPKPQPEPWIPSEGDWFEWRSKSPNGPWSDYVGLCYRSFIHPKNGAVWVEGIHEKYPDNRGCTWSAEFREFRLADPPRPYVPAPKDIFEVDGVRYQRTVVTDDVSFNAWNFETATLKRFHVLHIESGDIVCTKVEADE